MNSDQFRQWRQQAFQPPIQSLRYLRQPLIMGVLNVTPDSFSDGGNFLELIQAYDRVQSMIESGADIIDIGGESTKPGALPVSTEEELERVIPLIERIRANSDICISIDTYKAEVMQAAIEAGVSFINDVTALTGFNSLKIALSSKLPICLMHMKGSPQSMQDAPYYSSDVVDEINLFFESRVAACVEAGIAMQQLILDPGFGFGKSIQHNLQIVKRLGEFQYHGLPLLLGVSRKSTIGAITNAIVSDRLAGSLAASVCAVLEGVSILRTHDVKETLHATQMLHAIINA